MCRSWTATDHDFQTDLTIAVLGLWLCSMFVAPQQNAAIKLNVQVQIKERRRVPEVSQKREHSMPR